MDIELSTVVKWVITILVTGFIAQFGKMLAQFIVRKIKARREKSPEDFSVLPVGDGTQNVNGSTLVKGEVTVTPDTTAMEKSAQKKAAKAEKKRLKAEEKMKKKSGTS